MRSRGLTVIVPTFRRPAPLAACLASIQAQDALGVHATDVLVVDNDPDGSAAAVVSAQPAGAAVLRYVHQPLRGISQARNAGLDAARGDLIAFVDDDNRLTPRWLSTMVEALAAGGFDVAFGRLVPDPEAPPPPGREFLLKPYARDLGPVRADVTARRAWLGSGCSLFRREALEGRRFDPALGLTGGEDSAMLRDLARDGRRFLWVPEALAYEWVPAARMTEAALIRRRFRAGQVRTAMAGGRARQALWQGIGAAQAGLNFAASMALRAAGRPDRAASHAAQAYGGLGKLLWRAERPPLYGD